jgi:hypothetical protein
MEFRFGANESPTAVEIRGGIAALGIAEGAVLFSGNVEPSTMYWLADQRRSSFPYLAFHRKFRINPVLLRVSGLARPGPRVAVTNWVKDGGPASKFRRAGAKGIAFETQQHVGFLRVI